LLFVQLIRSAERSPNNKSSSILIENSESLGKVCRICLSSYTYLGDPLICPCKCSGTMQKIHLTCLHSWLKNQGYIIHFQNSITYFWSSFECELCKTKLPIQYEVNGKIIYLYQVELPNSNYVVLESINVMENMQKCLIICSFRNVHQISIVH